MSNENTTHVNDESDEAVEILREMNEREAQREAEAEVQAVRKKLQRGQWLCVAIIIPCALTAWLVVPAIVGLVFAAGSWRLGKQIKALDRHGAAVLDGEGGVDLDRAEELDAEFEESGEAEAQRVAKRKAKRDRLRERSFWFTPFTITVGDWWRRRRYGDRDGDLERAIEESGETETKSESE